MHTSLVKYKLLAIRLATLVAMLLLVPHIQSQTVYPLRTFATINGTTPYTLDGFVSQDGKLQVQIITDDVTIEHYAVKLRLTLQSSSVRIVTSAAYRPQPIYLEGGTQEILTSIDLADLFNPNNLTFEGITKAQYNSTGRLPEGVYRISVDVLDYYRNVVVSRSTPAIGMMYLTKAPLLTFPANGAEIDIATSPQIRFSWMTYHPINPAAEVVHRFRLWEVKPAGRNPYEVINVLKPIYEEEVTTGAALLLSPDLPLLNQGSTYVWQIQGVDLQNQVIYQNSGKSEAYTFRYGKSCVMPVPRIVSINTSGAQIAWNGNITTQQYRVNWKQSDDAEWHTDVTTLTTYGLKELIDNTDYQITVQAICGSEESETSAPIKFRTNRNVNYTCGTGNGQFDISNTEPLPTLSRFDEFKAADFIIEANEVTGSNGSFSGTGYALVPYLSFLKMMVTFDNITINTDRRMIKGQVEFVYDETTGMVLSLFKSDPKKQAEVASEFLAKGVTQVVTTTKEVSSVSVNDKTVTISLADGSTQQVTVDKKGDTVGVISPDGKTAYVADTGSGMVFTTPVPGTGEAANSSGVATPSQTGKYGCSVVVSPAKTQRYGFDAVGNGKIKPNNYFLNSKSGDAVAWKSIPAGGTDFVDVTVTGNCSPDSLRFLRENDMPVPSGPSGTARQLLLTGTAEGDEEVLTIALSSKQLQKDSTYRQTLTEAGALGLVTYTPIVRDVIMVPVNKATAPTGSGAIKTTLDKLFAPALVTWNVTIASAITVADITEEGFKTTGLSLASRYTSDMNKVIKAYKETHKISKNTLVLFFVTSPNSDKMGYMPLTGDYGFIFNLSSNVELLAHELSHGAFNLRHTFSDDAYWRGNGKAPVFPEKTTQNLMDYANGTELWKYQWDLIHDPEGILFGALDEEEGAYIEEGPVSEVARFINTIRCAKTNNLSTVNIQHAFKSYSVKVGDLLDQLNMYRGSSPSIASKEFEEATLKVYLSEGLFSSAADLYLGYHNFQLSVNNYERKSAKGINTEQLVFSANSKPIIFSFPIGTDVNIQKSVLDWIERESGIKTGGRPFESIRFNIETNDIRYLFSLSTCQLEQIYKEDRKKLIGKALQNVEDFLGLDKDSYQYLLANLIISTPKADVEDLIFYLSGIGRELESTFLELAPTAQEVFVQGLCELAKKSWKETQYLGDLNSYLLGLQSIQKDEHNRIKLGVCGTFNLQPGKYEFSSSIWVSDDGIFPSNDPNPQGAYEVGAFDPIECHIINDNSELESTQIMPAIVVKLYAVNLHIANIDQLLNIPKMVILPEFSGAVFLGANRLGNSTISLFKGFTKGLTSASGKFLGACGKLGYKLKKAGTEIALYTNLNVEIARFSGTGKLMTKVYPYNKEGVRVLSWEDEVEYITTVNTTKTGKLELAKADDGVIFFRELVSSSFIAKSGPELKTYLNGLRTKPLGKTYNGKFYKSVSKNAELNHNAKPDVISQYSIDEAWGRYDVQGESAMYYSKTFNGNKTEMSHYGDWNAYSTYEFNNVQIDNMLDLTDDVVRKSLGVEFDKLVLGMSNKTQAYEFTNVLGAWAREKGYKGLIVPGARGTKDYSNVIIFNQSDLSSALNGITHIKIK